MASPLVLEHVALAWPQFSQHMRMDVRIALHHAEALRARFSAAMFAVVPPHERAHGLVVRVGGARVSYGTLRWHFVPVAYYRAPDRVLSRRWPMLALGAPRAHLMMWVARWAISMPPFTVMVYVLWPFHRPLVGRW